MQLSLWFLLFVGLSGRATTEELEDPFLLPFGPNNGDQFATRDGCSLGNDLEQAFKIGNMTVGKVYVCLDGVLKFATPSELFDPWHFEDFDSINTAIVAPFLSRHRIDEWFLEEGCSYSVEENSFYGYYQRWCREVYDESFNFRWKNYGTEIWQNVWGISEETQLARVKQLHDRRLTTQQLQFLVRDDDKDARKYFGEDSTEYVNLANNVMSRQVTEGEDLEILTKLIQHRQDSADVIVEWAFVVTWYKIGFECDWRTNVGRDCFASFQLILTCGSHRCFSIFNYFEVTGEPYKWSGTLFYCGMFAQRKTSEDAQPSQCLNGTFSSQLLVQGSNIGVKGVWVYELIQSGEGNITFPDQLNSISDEINLTVQQFNNYDDDEPLLLKFGRQKGDKFFNYNYRRCWFTDISTRPFNFGIYEIKSFHVCRDGILSFINSFENSHDIARGYYRYDETAVISPLLLGEVYYYTNQYFDYTCLEAENPLYHQHGDLSYNDICFALASRNLYVPEDDFDVKSDDEASKFLFGVDATKYVNLAGNMFKREITDPGDFEIINRLINTKIPGFEATSGYIVTWYKIGHQSKFPYFNSFQCTIACDGKNDCVIVNDYFEIQYGAAFPEVVGNSGSIPLTAVDGNPQNLVEGSNFGKKGVWVFYFPGNGTDAITNFENSNETSIENIESVSPDEPFLMPFGPLNGDSFTNQRRIYTQGNQFNSRVCSLPQILETPITLTGIQFDWLFICLNGVIQLRSFGVVGNQNDFWFDQGGSPDWSQRDYNPPQYGDTGIFSLTILVFKTDKYDASVRDEQADYLCALALNASSSNDLYYQYFEDSSCPSISNNWSRERWNWYNAITMSGWTDRDVLQSVLDWNTKGRHQENLDFRSDDSLSKQIFGEDSTKYVNLANNVFQRESTNDPDLRIVTDLIRSDPDNSQFEATWCFVVTWYKVASGPNADKSNGGYLYFLNWFNSFQLVIACDTRPDSQVSTKCFAIYDYFELQSAKPNGKVGIFWKNHPGYELPVDYRNLTTSSNCGSPGKWVFDLSNMSKPLGGNISYHEQEGVQDEEPFLLPFGPNHGDKFEQKKNPVGRWRSCGSRESLLGQYTVESIVYKTFTLCINGFLLSENDACRNYNPFSSCRYPVFAIYPMENVNTRDSLIDYMCSESYFDDSGLRSWEIREFCPFLFDRSSIAWYPDWLYDEDRRNQYGVTEDQVRAVEDWNTFLSQNPEKIDIYSDDDLTRAIMGSDTTKYVNLVNNVFKRETRNESDLATLTSFMQPVSLGFQATWAFVATWYKISPDTWPRFLHYNSYQTILTCDGSSGSPARCFVIFDYFEIQWTGSNRGQEVAHCGVKQDADTFVELPKSGTEEVRNLWVESNVEVPGLWVIELIQKPVDDPIQLVGQECRWSISPDKVRMHAIETGFTITGYTCLNKAAFNRDPKIDVIFKGVKREVTLQGSLGHESGNITCQLEYWGEAEEVDVTVKLNDVIQITSSSKVLFYDPRELIDPPPTLTISFLENKDLEIFLGSFLSEVEKEYDVMTVKCLFQGNHGQDVEIDIQSVLPEGTKLTVANSREMNSFAFAVCVVETSEKDTFYSDPVKGGTGLQCETWVREEDERDLRSCIRSLSVWYGCPREVTTRRWWWRWEERDDAWFARSEVNDGVMGWQYDVCCNDQNLDASATVSQNGYCNNCEFNPGADFCIKSIPVACEDGNTDEIHYVSNQCCYSEGRLIEESEPGVGTMHLEESTAGNIVDHSEADLEPFKSCCLKDEGTDGCDTFYKYRPVIKGSYWSRVMRVARGDPHITTIDNTTYTFNGLNVYTLVETNLNKPTSIQASTRVSGQGTLFSGLAVKYEDTVFECFITKNGEFAVVINGKEIELHAMRTFTTNNVSITENADENSFSFFFRENGVIIKVLITNSFLNFFTSVPPTFNGRMKGLLGFYDGDPENDLLAADGKTVSANSSMADIHKEFGETWSVEKKDWIFQHRAFVREILQDMEEGSSYEASYALKFETPEQEEKAREVCKNDTQCLLDVSLVGDISVADAFTKTEAQLAVFKVFNEVFQSNVPDEELFREIDETSSPSNSTNSTNTTNSTTRNNNNWALNASPGKFESVGVSVWVFLLILVSTCTVLIG